MVSSADLPLNFGGSPTFPQPNGVLEKPKKAKTAYNLFFQAQRQEMLKEMDKGLRVKIGFAEMARTVAKKWKAVNETERSFYEHLAKADKERYDREMEIYERYAPPEKQRKLRHRKPKKMTSSKQRDACLQEQFYESVQWESLDEKKDDSQSLSSLIEPNPIGFETTLPLNIVPAAPCTPSFFSSNENVGLLGHGTGMTASIGSQPDVNSQVDSDLAQWLDEAFASPPSTPSAPPCFPTPLRSAGGLIRNVSDEPPRSQQDDDSQVDSDLAQWLDEAFASPPSTLSVPPCFPGPLQSAGGLIRNVSDEPPLSVLNDQPQPIASGTDYGNLKENLGTECTDLFVSMFSA